MVHRFLSSSCWNSGHRQRVESVAPFNEPYPQSLSLHTPLAGFTQPQIGQWINATGSQEYIPCGNGGTRKVSANFCVREKKRKARKPSGPEHHDGKRLQLGDIATLERRPKDRSVEAHYAGNPLAL